MCSNFQPLQYYCFFFSSSQLSARGMECKRARGCVNARRSNSDDVTFSKAVQSGSIEFYWQFVCKAIYRVSFYCLITMPETLWRWTCYRQLVHLNWMFETHQIVFTINYCLGAVLMIKPMSKFFPETRGSIKYIIIAFYDYFEIYRTKIKR